MGSESLLNTIKLTRLPESNGKAENAVKTIKNIMRKAYEAGQNPYMALLDFRNTTSEVLDTLPA